MLQRNVSFTDIFSDTVNTDFNVLFSLLSWSSVLTLQMWWVIKCYIIILIECVYYMKVRVGWECPYSTASKIWKKQRQIPVHRCSQLKWTNVAWWITGKTYLWISLVLNARKVQHICQQQDKSKSHLLLSSFQRLWACGVLAPSCGWFWQQPQQTGHSF